jgi:hypothetical protein
MAVSTCLASAGMEFIIWDILQNDNLYIIVSTTSELSQELN